MENRLASWRRNSLSRGGRLILLKSCLMSIPIYFLSLFPIPVTIAQRLERLVRNFLWGESAIRKAFCLVRWDACSKPKSVGGLGIRSFLLMNKSLCSKWIWRYTKEKHSLWREVIRARHGSEQGDVFPKIPRSSHGVGLWKNLCKQVKFVHNCSSFEIGNGKFARFWIDKWCSAVPLRLLAPNLFRIVKRKQSTVSEVVRLRNGQLQIHMSFYHQVEYAFMHEVMEVHNMVFAQPLDLTREDVLLWGVEGDDDTGFSVSAAYDRLLEPELIGLPAYPVACVWKRGVPLKVQFFAWLATLNRISSFDLMRRKGIIWVNHCSMCMCNPETATHLLLHCGFAQQIWSTFLRSFNVIWVQPAEVLEVLIQWQYYDGRSPGQLLWSLLPHAIFWCLWSERNARCFDGIQRDTMTVVLAVRGLLAHWCSVIADFRDVSTESFLFRFDRISNLYNL